MKRVLLLLTLLFSTFHIKAQITNPEQPFLPKGFAPGEEEMMPDYINNLHARNLDCISTAPAANSIRTPGEWEELQAVVITWTQFPSILTEIVRHAREECEVIIVCSNDAVVKNTLGAAGVDWTSNVSFIEAEFNSV